MPIRTTRYAAARFHLVGSAAVVGLVAALVFGLWYPGPLRHLAGGTALFLILAGVDLVMGPLLTAVVFNPAKSRRQLTLDLAAVVLLQLGALGYGVWTMAVARPVLLAFEVDLFRVVTAVQVVDDQLTEAPAELRALPWTGPRTIAVARPSGARQVEATMLGLSGVHLAMQPRYWVPHAQQRAQVLERARPASQLPAELQHRLATELVPWPGAAVPPLAELRWLPVMAPRAGGTLFIDRQGLPVAFAPFDVP